MLAPSPVKLTRIRALLTSQINAIKTGGTRELPNSIREVSGKVRRAFLSFDKYYLYARDFKENEHIQVVNPRVEDVTMDIVFLPMSIEEYEVLGEKGFDFRNHPDKMVYSPGTGKETIVFLGIRGSEIIYRSCISTFRNAVYQHIYPQQLDSKTTCYQGFNWTHPAYRKRGLYTWAQTVMFNFMKDQGYHRIVMLEPEEQIGPRKVQDRLGSKMLCESFAFRFMVLVNYRWNRPPLG